MKNIIKYSVLGVISILFISGMLTASANGWHASIGDYVWHDLNHDGIQDEEPGIPGVVVNLYKCNGDFVDTTTTDSNGFYLFYYLDPGDYYLEFIAPDDYVITLQDQGEDDSIDSDSDGNGITICTTLESYEHDMTWDAGMYIPEEYEGLTPGFWKNHLDAWEGYSADQQVGDVFNVPSELDGKSLLDALKFKGGKGEIGAARILLRVSVAALLNAANDDVHYPLTRHGIIDQVNDALDSGDRDEMLDLKDMFDEYNNYGTD